MTDEKTAVTSSNLMISVSIKHYTGIEAVVFSYSLSNQSNGRNLKSLRDTI